MLSLMDVFFNLEARKTFRHNATLKDACYLVDTANIFLAILGYSHMACIGRASTVSLAQQFLIYLHISLPYSSVFLMIP